MIIRIRVAYVAVSDGLLGVHDGAIERLIGNGSPPRTRVKSI
jgi:hypothetical protein